MAQSVERVLGKDEVTGSIPVSSSIVSKIRLYKRIFDVLGNNSALMLVYNAFDMSQAKKQGTLRKRALVILTLNVN